MGWYRSLVQDGSTRQVTIQSFQRAHACRAVCHRRQFHGGAGARVNQFPGVALIVYSGGACAGGAGAGGAVIFACERYAVALLFFSCDCGGGVCAQSGGNSACNGESFDGFGHLHFPFGVELGPAVVAVAWEKIRQWMCYLTNHGAVCHRRVSWRDGFVKIPALERWFSFKIETGAPGFPRRACLIVAIDLRPDRAVWPLVTIGSRSRPNSGLCFAFRQGGGWRRCAPPLLSYRWRGSQALWPASVRGPYS